MSTTRRRTPPLLLLAGDSLALLVVTWVGFASHNLSLLNPRWLLTFLPLLAAWAFAAPWFGAYTPGLRSSLSGVWRSALAMLLAAPLAMWLRGILLGAGIVPVFVAVIMGVSALGIALWRLLWWLISRRTEAYG